MVVIDLEPAGDPGAEIVENHVGLFHQAIEELAPLVFAQIDADALLLRLRVIKNAPMPFNEYFGSFARRARVPSPVPGRSTFMVWAPRSVRSNVPYGPESIWVRSSITTSERAFMTDCRFSCWLAQMGTARCYAPRIAMAIRENPARTIGFRAMR